MTPLCAENERIKHKYFAFLREARGYDQGTIDGIAKALHRFEIHTKFRPFRRFRHQQAVSFKRHLREQVNQRHGEPLSKATLLSSLNALKAFFIWLAAQTGYRGDLVASHAEYFSLPVKEIRIAKADRGRPAPTLVQVRQVIVAMPASTDTELRDQAVIAFTLLTGARDKATISFKLKHVDLPGRRVFQDARDVRTKFSKSFVTAFFPVGDDIFAIFERWVIRLKTELGFGPEDPLFPATRNAFEPVMDGAGSRLDRRHWSQTSPVRKIFRTAFERAGLPYSNPHSLRKTLVALGHRLGLTPEQLKAWSQNLGHEHVLTTLVSYSDVPAERQAEIIRALAEQPEPDAVAIEVTKRLLEVVRQHSVT